MTRKVAIRFALISAILFISLVMVYAETASDTNKSLMEGQNITPNQTMNKTINQTLNQTINQTTNTTADMANVFGKVKGDAPGEGDR
ncbi:Uncharacterised protein [uncultured archaeon]|nr:Uncharacterised protein [uncultured archaeon]